MLCVLRLAVERGKRKNYPIKGVSLYFDVRLPLSVEQNMQRFGKGSACALILSGASVLSLLPDQIKKLMRS